jgi:hypothetical protein
LTDLPWTEPTHVAPGDELDHAKFNAETVDNLKHLHVAKVGRFGRLAALTVPDTTWTEFTWDFAVFETIQMWNREPYPVRISPSLAGFWMVAVRVQWPAGSGTRSVRLQRNGVDLASQDTRPALANTSNTSLSAVVEMDGLGDYFNFHVWQDSAGSVSIGSGLNHSLDVIYQGA